MRPPVSDAVCDQGPDLIAKTKPLIKYLKTLPAKDVGSVMKISSKLATTTHELIASWTDEPTCQRAAIDSFLGDIYSGLQVLEWSNKDLEYANQHLRILSGLYGILRPQDGIYPYRLEMGYRLPDPKFKNLYSYWGASVAQTLPEDSTIINLAAVEYSRLVTPYVDERKVITPSFLTISPKTNEPTFVVVHAKIARGAFAGWLIRNQIDSPSQLQNFEELGYAYSKGLSTPNAPVFICKSFGGIGLSVRLK